MTNISKVSGWLFVFVITVQCLFVIIYLLNFVNEIITSLQVWFFNVPHTRLVEDKGGQNWITRQKNKFKFPGGGTQFIHGANEYLDHISKVRIV